MKHLRYCLALPPIILWMVDRMKPPTPSGFPPILCLVIGFLWSPGLVSSCLTHIFYSLLGRFLSARRSFYIFSPGIRVESGTHFLSYAIGIWTFLMLMVCLEQALQIVWLQKQCCCLIRGFSYLLWLSNRMVRDSPR